MGSGEPARAVSVLWFIGETGSHIRDAITAKGEVNGATDSLRRFLRARALKGRGSAHQGPRREFGDVLAVPEEGRLQADGARAVRLVVTSPGKLRQSRQGNDQKA